MRSISSSTVESNLQVINFSKHEIKVCSQVQQTDGPMQLCAHGKAEVSPPPPTGQGDQSRKEVELYEYTYFRTAPLNLREDFNEFMHTKA